MVESDWYTLDIKVQNILKFVILRAQKPIGISIGPIYKVKMDALIGVSIDIQILDQYPNTPAKTYF